ncbi:MAG: tetratricopeptide repeat protein [Candidatus Rokuibacteriota bacterium]
MHLSIPIPISLSVLLAVCLAVDHRAVAQPPEVRTITMRIAADETYRTRPDWEATLRRAVQVVSDIYEPRFQIRFAVLDVVPVTAGPPGSLSRLDEMAAAVQLGEAELLIGFSGGPCLKAGGWAVPFDRVAVIMATCAEIASGKSDALERVLSHELAHLFGAFHPAISVDSVMRARGGGPPDQFDDQNARVMRLMRSYDFRRGVLALDEATRRAWRVIYAEGHQRLDEVNPLASALVNAALRLARSGKTVEAEAALHEAIRTDQLLAPPHATLGALYAERGRFEEAARELRMAKNLDFNLVEARTDLGFVLLRLGNDQEALSEFETVLRINPKMVRARVGLGTVLVRRERLDEAVRECTEAIRLAPEEATAFSARGFAYERKGELGQAIVDYDEAIRLKPGLAPAFNGRGVAYRRKGDLERAIQDFDQAIRLEPTSASVWNNRCFTHAIAGRLEVALADCHESLRLQPRSGRTLDSRGLINLKLGRLDHAIADYDAALGIDQKYAHALYGRGLAKRRKGDHVGAEADLAAARAIMPRVADEYASYGIEP